MVKRKEHPYLNADGSIDLEPWLDYLAEKYTNKQIGVIHQACALAIVYDDEVTTITQRSCLQQGLALAELLVDLHADAETIAASMLYGLIEYTDLTLEDIREQFSDTIAHLIRGALQMDAIHSLPSRQRNLQNNVYIDNLRKMLLAMVEDVRVVLIKLAERTTVIRAASKLDHELQQQVAKETMEIYAPLANRLGIGHLKWELEDLAFRYLEADAYKELAKLLDQRRIDREKYVNNVVMRVEQEVQDAGITKFEIAGRAKHIYSIYRKMRRKDVDYSQIYDVSAVRVLVPKIEDCYTVLSAIHDLWEHIPDEFDDYISNPKANGYRSLHTAVKGPEQRNVEVQIRTFDMHQESELGVAAHWKYKEGSQQQSDYEEKIAWLRQVLEWQQELTGEDPSQDNLQMQKIFSNRSYVFTPAGEIIDLPANSTPLDFAYHIHSEVGHRCRGAKVNGKIVPLTYALKTGEQVEVLTGRHPAPSRDWLNPHSGYLKTHRARSKVQHWFKQQDYDKHVIEGQHALEHELQKRGMTCPQLQPIAQRYNLQTTNDLYAAIANGDVRLQQVVNSIEQNQTKTQTPADEDQPTLASPQATGKTSHNDISIEGLDDLLTHTAKCCKPLPGDDIAGFVTHGRGISIHRRDCPNLQRSPNQDRILNVQWSNTKNQTYSVDLILQAHNRPSLVKDVSATLVNERISLLALTTSIDTSQVATIYLTIEISDLEALEFIIHRLQRIENMITVSRSNAGKY